MVKQEQNGRNGSSNLDLSDGQQSPTASDEQNGHSEYKDISQSAFAEEKRKLLDVIDKIRDIGGDLIPQLPRIVVIGNQSAGKSSLIEAIARINVPRDMGTCTRCPSEIRLRSSNAAWTCLISLRWEYDQIGQKLRDVRTVPFGDRFTDPSQVEIMLRRAQLAILNPKTEQHLFLSADLANFENTGELGFSRNVICIEVTGPGLTDLTFVDLPGIISSVQDTSQTDLIELIKSMVKEYIVGNSIILVAITLRDDIDNQAAILEARRADPEGNRTIGVLTKPDTLQVGEESQWLPVVQNIKNHLRLGYFVTKQPSPSEIKAGTTFDKSRQREQAFFRTTEPWATLPTDTRARLGTPNLTSTLSTLLTDAIKRSLPGIAAKITSSLQKVRDGLADLPDEPSNNPLSDMLELCQQVRDDLALHVKGSEGHVQLVQQNKAHYQNFKQMIHATAPLFLPYTKHEVAWNGEYEEPEFLSDECPGSNENPVHNLDDVRKAIVKATTRELPFSVPFSAKVSMMMLPIKQWPDLADMCFDSIFPDVETLCDDVATNAFGRFEHGPLLRLVKDILADTIAELKEKTKHALDIILDMEEYPGTYNDHYFTATRFKLIARYQEQRKQRRTGSKPAAYDEMAIEDERNIAEAISYLVRSHQYRNVKEADLPKLLPEDPYHQEITFMAETRAYFQVAYKRIIDNVPHAIDRNFIFPLARAIHEALISGLQMNTIEGAEKCREYLKENPHVVHKRETLHSTKKRLDRAKAELRLIGL
ncbi:hypothetical protein CALVIDRAFT_187292 [Calocera viscosa TUFC12733]|uniref:P-loop containing nucleoside triphosphate hydrolase protein n=1 Tax=Calocera viscosa (strain TUFC12733) TaxID=1330018 RepID=A0A167KUP7_CALVF|nr:hypothetical protein CALVIDRAFT_187292 [Calocera viscosa TUFC12733]